MAVTFTPRDRLGRLVDFARKSIRYWWLVPLFVLIGGALSVAFAMTRKPSYQSWSVLFYQEKISSSMLQGRQMEAVRNTGDRYRELLLARNLLSVVVNDPAINPFPAEFAKEGPDEAIDLLRKEIKFEARGMSAFRIVYKDSKPERAKAVTERLTTLLQKAEEEIRRSQANATADFANKQKADAATELRVRERSLAEFLAKHPEFVQEASGASSEGAGILRQKAGAAVVPASSNPRLATLERQRQRIVARLNAGTGAAVAPAPRSREQTPEQQAAQQVVAEADREFLVRQRDLESAQSKFTDQHPSVKKARDDVAAALQRLRRAQAAVPADAEAPPVAPATQQDREALQRELAQVEALIYGARSAAKEPTTTPVVTTNKTAETATDRVVKLETEHSELRRMVAEQRDRVESLSDSVFRAQIDADQQLAEEGTRLTIVDPAFKPLVPIGKGRTFLVLAGVFVFFSLGALAALGMGLVDDRVYRRADIDGLELLPVLATIPKATAKDAGTKFSKSSKKEKS